MKHFNFRSRNFFSGPYVLGVILIPAGIFILITPVIMDGGSSLTKTISTGIGAILLGFLILSSFSGTLIDFKEHKYKEYFSFCGMKFGNWNPLESIVKVKVNVNSFMSQNTPKGISPTLSGKVTEYKVLLLSDQGSVIFSFRYQKQEKALKNARLLAEGFNITLDQ